MTTRQRQAEEQKELREQLRSFHGDGFFQWQFSNEEHKNRWSEWHYDEEKYWGGFSREPFDTASYVLPDWAIGPFAKFPETTRRA